MDEEKLIQAIKDELNRQNQLDRMGTPYIFDDEGTLIGIDGWVELRELAQALLKVLA